MNTTRFLTLLIIAMPCWATADVVIGESGTSCAQDGACTNRFHPDIPMVASAEQGERIVMKGKNARDLQLVSTDQAAADRFASSGPSVIAHPLVGPVFINGA